MPELWQGGKEVWKSLKTSHFSVAQARLAEFLKETPPTRQQWKWRSLDEDDLWRGWETRGELAVSQFSRIA